MAKPQATESAAPPFSALRSHVQIPDGSWKPEVVAAIKAMNEGKATGPQQQIVMNFILYEMGHLYGLSFQPDDRGGDRSSAHMEGRRFVAWHIHRAVVTSFQKLTGKQTSGEKPT